MSIFTVGGNVGVTLGPLLATPALIYFGLRGSIVMVFPALIMCIVFLKIGPKMRSLSQASEEGGEQTKEAFQNEWGKFLWLSIAIVSRSIIHQSLNTFLPLYWINVLGQSRAESGMALSFLFFWGAVATIVGGYVADRIGVVNILKIAWILVIPSLFGVTMITHHLGAWLILIPLAFGLHMLNTPAVLLGQKYLPASIGFASGITMGLGNSAGGIAAPILGNYADLNGLAAALRLLLILPFIGTFIIMTLRPPRQS